MHFDDLLLRITPVLAILILLACFILSFFLEVRSSKRSRAAAVPPDRRRIGFSFNEGLSYKGLSYRGGNYAHVHS